MKLTKNMTLAKSKLAVCLASSLIIRAIVILTTLLAIQNNNKTRTIKNLKTALEKINKKEVDRDSPALIATRNNFLAQKAELKNWVSALLSDKRRQYKAIEQAGVPPYKTKFINLLTTKIPLVKRSKNILFRIIWIPIFMRLWKRKIYQRYTPYQLMPRFLKALPECMLFYLHIDRLIILKLRTRATFTKLPI